AVGREAEYLVLKQLQLGVLQELLRVVAFEQLLDQPPEPIVGALLGRTVEAWALRIGLPAGRVLSAVLSPVLRPILSIECRGRAVAAGGGGNRLGASRRGILVKRMRRHAILGYAVHLLGADLQLDALVARADDGGVDRLVVVLLGRRDVVLEAARHRAPV